MSVWHLRNPAVTALKACGALREKLSEPVHLPVKEKLARERAISILLGVMGDMVPGAGIEDACISNLHDLKWEAYREVVGNQYDLDRIQEQLDPGYYLNPPDRVKLEAEKIDSNTLKVRVLSRGNTLKGKELKEWWCDAVNALTYRVALASFLKDGPENAVKWRYYRNARAVQELVLNDYPLERVITTEDGLVVTLKEGYAELVADPQLEEKVLRRLEELLPPKPEPVITTDADELTKEDVVKVIREIAEKAVESARK